MNSQYMPSPANGLPPPSELLRPGAHNIGVPEMMAAAGSSTFADAGWMLPFDAKGDTKLRQSALIAVDRLSERRHVNTGARLRGAEIELHVQNLICGKEKVQLAGGAGYTTADFSSLYAEMMQIEVIRAPQISPSPIDVLFYRASDTVIYPKTTKIRVKNRNIQRFPAVPELGGFPSFRDYSLSDQEITCHKYGGKTGFTWESMVNGSLEVIEELPQMMAECAALTEAHLKASVLYDTTGWKTTTSQPSIPNTPFGIPGLKSAMHEFLYRSNSQGMPYTVDAAYLIIPPGLRFAAAEILNSPEIRDPSATSVYVTRNVIQSELNLQVIIDPWIPYFVTDETVAANMWAIFASPAAVPHLRWGTMPGYENWEVATRYTHTGGDERFSFDQMLAEWRLMKPMSAAVVEANDYGSRRSNG